MTTTYKITAIILFICILGFIVFFGLWQQASLKLKQTEESLEKANLIIQSLQLDNNKLLQYTKEKDQEIKKIEIQYKETLKNIPSDKCGDMKPSTELLEFFRRNVQ